MKLTRDDLVKSLFTKTYDFADKVAPMYELLNWTWGKSCPPSAEEIQETLERLILNLLKDKKATRISTGGLAVFCEKEDDEYQTGIEFKYKDIYFGNSIEEKSI